MKSDPERPRAIEAEIRKLRNELNNFMVLIASDKVPASILEQVAQRENRIEQLESEQKQLQAIEPTEIDMRRIKKVLQGRIGRFKELIYSDVPVALQALRKLLAEPMQFSPVMRDGRKAYGFKGKIITGALIDPSYIQVASPRGFDLIPQLHVSSKILNI